MGKQVIFERLKTNKRLVGMLPGALVLSALLVFCSADNERQLQAICDVIEEALREIGIRRYHSEGTADTGWVLLDFGHVVVHVFATPERKYYDIEGLWNDATQVVRIL